MAVSCYGDLISEYDFEDDETYGHSYDAQWNTEALLDDGESQQASYKYRAFGLVAAETGPAQSKLTFVGKQGYYRDEELGLYMLGASNGDGRGGRYYNPATARFLSEDPAKDDLNEYRYVRNNPINVIDPSGQVAVDQKVKAVGSRTEVYVLHLSEYSSGRADLSLETYEWSKGRKCADGFYSLARTNWYREPFEGNRFYRSLPVDPDDQNIRARPVVSDARILQAVQDHKFGTPSQLFPVNAAPNRINERWGEWTGVEVAKIVDEEGTISGFIKGYGYIVAEDLKFAKEQSCKALERIPGMEGLCDTIGKLACNCQEAASSAYEAAEKLIGAMFFSSDALLKTLIEGVTEGLKLFGKDFLKNLGTALLDWTGLSKVPFVEIIEAVKPLFQVEDGSIDWPGLLKAAATWIGFTFSNMFQVANQQLGGALGFVVSLAGAIQKFVETNNLEDAVNWILGLLPDSVRTLIEPMITFVKGLRDWAGLCCQSTACRSNFG